MPATINDYVEMFRNEWNMTITENDVGYEANGYFIHPEEVTVEGDSLTGKIYYQITEWVVTVEQCIPSMNRMEPDDVDDFEISRERNIGNAFARILFVQHELAVNTSLENMLEYIADEDFETQVAG